MFNKKVFSGYVYLAVGVTTLTIGAHAQAKTIYVSTSGSDSASGTSTAPYRTINQGMRKASAGDEVRVRSGIYNESVWIGNDGSSSAYITLRSDVRHGAKIQVPSSKQYGINIGANYVVVDGFEVANAPSAGITSNRYHHLKIMNNKVHDCKSNGISVTYGDYLTIEGNEVYRNASSGARSGISIWHPNNLTKNSNTSAFRIIVRNNIAHHNVTAPTSSGHTDGNGIIFDDFESTQNASNPSYRFPSLIEGNIAYANGGRGIQVYSSRKVTIRNNTAYYNSTDTVATGTWKSEISNQASSDTLYVNNIAVANPNLSSAAMSNVSYKKDGPNSNVRYYNNLTFKGLVGNAAFKIEPGNSVPNAANGNQLGVNPLLVNPPSDMHLRSVSPAINKGTSTYGLPSLDMDGEARVQDGQVDIGADEFD